MSNNDLTVKDALKGVFGLVVLGVLIALVLVPTILVLRWIS